MQQGFSKFEKQIEALIEGGFNRLFAGRLHPADVGARLLRAMEDNMDRTITETPVAPDEYRIYANPSDISEIRAAQPDVERMLAEQILKVARSDHVVVQKVPSVTLIDDSDIRIGDVRITATHSQRTQTEKFAPLNLPDNPDGASLILDDGSLIQIRGPIINIGRNEDNDVVLPAPTVSRHHAQIRVNNGAYVLYDLKSMSGTLLNGNLVQEAMPLESGDKIEIAQYRLQYLAATDDS